MDGIIKAEWDPLTKVYIHKPGMEMFLGLLEPYGSLYERAFSRFAARNEHEMLTQILKQEFKVPVFHLKGTILQEAEKRPKIRQQLIEQAKLVLDYVGDKKFVDMAQREFDRNCKYYDNNHFFSIMLIHPLIEAERKKGTRNISLNIIQRQPLANLYFMRDQQFVTDRGIVVCRLAKPSRRLETQVTKFLWEDVLGVSILHEMTAPATIEGGEFLPMGKFALIGIGDRTNQAAIDQLLGIEFGFQELGVVRQPPHPLVSATQPDPMINMHLDTYFNVAASDVVVGCEILLKKAKVDIYHNLGGGEWEKEKGNTNLYDYMRKKGFHIIDITTLEQMSYASNFLCIKERKIVAIQTEAIVGDVLKNLRERKRQNPKRYSRLLAQAEKDYEYLKNTGQFFPHKTDIYKYGIDVYPINLRNCTGGYGGAHCMTCAFSRGFL